MTWDCLTLRSTLRPTTYYSSYPCSPSFLASRHFPNYQLRIYMYLPVLFSSRCGTSSTEGATDLFTHSHKSTGANPSRNLHRVRQIHLAVLLQLDTRDRRHPFADINIGNIINYEDTSVDCSLIVYSDN